MDYEFSDEQCCVRCQEALNSLHRWYYMDNYGVQQGPFDSFFILYYISSNYFEENSAFFVQDKLNGTPSNFNTLLNYLDTIVEDVKSHSNSLFTCTHFIENFSSSYELGDSETAQLLDGVSAFKQADEVRLTTDDIFGTVSPQSMGEFHPASSTFEYQNDELHRSQTKTILKKRVEDNLKEAEAHLQRVNSRKVSHRFGSQFMDESPTSQEFN
ncbi:uncharacterized protein TA10360 [Theileria annulata]|uniref:GYF domain containing protein, putative n=1 Tax=Theileria annulata TaxID=5874 RepID=Q4U8X6_THEAN|nr:uncharacterized protein TA10360 [Theileria annulata]CAI76727.1 hypothetical protein TA10360 [Theileria annulata]|eukprot:XP_953352.1 hypothetical protein TA10360 [Theileria annulata]